MRSDDSRARPAAPVDAGRDPTRAAALDRLALATATVPTSTAPSATAAPSTLLTATLPTATLPTSPLPTATLPTATTAPDPAATRATAPWAVKDPDGERPDRVAPEEVDLAAWADPPWWRRIRWSPDRLAGIALVVLVIGLGAFSVHRLLSTVPTGAPVPELPLATPGATSASTGTDETAGTDAAAAQTAPGQNTQAPSTAAAGADDEPVVVAVVGLVGRSGLVTLTPGARVADALDRAGGVLDGGDSDGLNLARKVVDGEQILVGVAPGPDGPRGPRSSIVGPGGDSSPPAPNGPAAPATPGSGGQAAAAPGLVNINTADAAALDALPGVGPVTASSILSWRTANGSFGSVDQLAEVDGIGPATLARLRPLVTV